MPYTLTYFGDVALPDAMQDEDFSTGQVGGTLVDSIGGRFNYFGSTTRLPRSQQFTHRGLYVGEVIYRVTDEGDFRVIDNGAYRSTAVSKLADLQGKTDDLKAMIGQWAQLWRSRISDGVETWKQCRLLQVRHVEDVDKANAVSEIECAFETLHIAWRAAEITSEVKNPAAGTTTWLNIANGGTLPVRDAILTVTSLVTTTTSVRLYSVVAGVDFTWAGSLAAGQTLTIDAGTLTATIGDTDEYANLTFNAGHTIDDWILLPLGQALFYVSVTGSNATVTLSHYDQFV